MSKVVLSMMVSADGYIEAPNADISLPESFREDDEMSKKSYKSKEQIL